jgi:hypothetical protein
MNNVVNVWRGYLFLINNSRTPVEETAVLPDAKRMSPPQTTLSRAAAPAIPGFLPNYRVGAVSVVSCHPYRMRSNSMDA